MKTQESKTPRFKATILGFKDAKNYFNEDNIKYYSYDEFTENELTELVHKLIAVDGYWNVQVFRQGTTYIRTFKSEPIS